MIKKLALIFGVVFVVVGLLGFVKNPIVGMDGIFFTNAIHNIAHLLIGIVLIVVAKKESTAILCMKIFGAVYLLLAVLGFMAVSNGQNMILGLVSTNTADNWLHVVLGVVLLAIGFMSGSKKPMLPPQAPATGMGGGQM